jgi:hypothetical protein
MSGNGTAYISVRVRTRRDLITIHNAYLYGHTHVLATFPNGHYTQAVLETRAQSPSEALYLANYQAGRLSSGNYGASVYPSFGDALTDMDTIAYPRTPQASDLAK